MSPIFKILIGLAAVAGVGAVFHGPLGGGEAFIGNVEAEARAAVAKTNVAGVEVRMGRAPLSRRAALSGPADEFQREGQGELKGLSDIVRDVPGVSGIRWADRAEGDRAMPLIVEVLGMMLLAYLLGLGLGALLRGRKKRERYA